jgi:hypothetical protein
MPRRPSADIAKRNDHIYAQWRDGASLTQLAEQYERSPQLIGRILAAYHPDLEDDDDRALHRGRLEDLYQEIREVVARPGYMMAPNGRAATGPDGEPIPNLGLKVEAVKVTLAVLESQRRLDGRDKPSQRNITISLPEAEQAYQADIARKRQEIEGQLRVIRGEVEPAALPPAAEG